MIFHPKIGQKVTCNYKDKSMPYQEMRGEVVCVGKGPGPINVLVKSDQGCVVIPRGNIVVEDKR